MRSSKKSLTITNEDQLLLFTPPSDWKRIDELPDLRHCKEIVVDTENRDEGLATGKGPGWATGQGHICGIAVAWRDSKLHSHYFPIKHPDSDCFDHHTIGNWLKRHMQAGVRFMFHNGSYDVGWIDYEWDLSPTSYKIDDTCCMAYMVDENRRNYSLNHLCHWRGIPGKNELVLKDAASAYGVDPKNGLWKLPARYVGNYAEQDATSTLLLAESLKEELDIVRKAYELEMELMPMVHAMRKRGIRIDENMTQKTYTRFKKISATALEDISDKLGQTTGIDDLRSNKWLEDKFDHFKISYPLTAKTGKGSFEAKWMKDHDHWLPPLIVRAKQFEDAAEKFIKTYIMDFQHNSRIHASVHQFKAENLYNDEKYGGGTRTYRFSYSDPPLQQIPHRNEEMAKEIRSCFIPEENDKWLRIDYSQQEFRLIVHFASLMKLSKADEAAQQYREDPDTDFHKLVASWTGLERKPAKDCNFAKAFGAGVGKFAMMIKKSREEAERIMQQYDEKLPFVKELFDHANALAEQRGYIKLLDGARIRFDMWFAGWRSNDYKTPWKDQYAHCNYEEAKRRISDPQHAWYRQTLRRSGCNKAMNSLIQGNAARQTKKAMLDCWKAGHVPLLQVHDELGFSVNNKKTGIEISEIMCNAVPLSIPMKADLVFGSSWAG